MPLLTCQRKESPCQAHSTAKGHAIPVMCSDHCDPSTASHATGQWAGRHSHSCRLLSSFTLPSPLLSPSPPPLLHSSAFCPSLSPAPRLFPHVLCPILPTLFASGLRICCPPSTNSLLLLPLNISLIQMEKMARHNKNSRRLYRRISNVKKPGIPLSCPHLACNMGTSNETNR